MTLPRFLFVLALGISLCLAISLPAVAVTLTVDTTADDASLVACDAATPNDCSLRGALIKARSLTGPTTIEVPAGTYTLTQFVDCPWRATTQFTSPLTLNMLGLCLRGDTTLVGAGADVTIIDANQPAGNNGTIATVVYVDAFANAEIRGITLKRGNFSHASTWGTGGGIRNAGSLLVVDSVISDNYSTGGAGGIHNTGALTLLRSTIARNSSPGDGGGIFNATGGSLVVSDSVLTENSGVNGGALANEYGDANITGSTISANTGTSFGGAIYNGNFRTIFLTNTTISGNRGRSAGGIYVPQSSTAHLQNVTITNNTARWFEPANFNQGVGGGLYSNVGTVTMANSIVAGNIAGGGTGPDCLTSSGNPLTSEGHNLIQNTRDCVIAGDTTGNILGQDPKLGVLTQNGGPTPTHALADGSPAIDAGSPATPGSGGTGTCVATDQRGFLRPLGAQCDIGAFERNGSFAVAAVLPAKGGNTGTVTALISGNGFASGASVMLRRAGQPDVTGTPAVVDAGGSAISAVFDLTGRPAGAWDVVVVNPDSTSQTLGGGFTIEAGGGPSLWVDVVGVVRRAGRRSTLTIIYGNRGNVDGVGVPLWLNVPTGYSIFTLFPIAPPPPRTDEVRPDWTQVAPVLSTQASSTVVQVPLLLPVVPAGFTGILRIVLTLPAGAQDSLILAVIGDPIAGSAQFVDDTVAGATAYVQRNFGVDIPDALVPDLDQYLRTQLDTIMATGRTIFVNSLGTETEVYSLAHLSLDLALFGVVRAASVPAGTRPTDTWFARAYSWLRGIAHRVITTVVAWLAPNEAWAGGATRGQSCGLVMAEGQSGCGGKQDTLQDILPPEIPPPPGCDPTKPKEFVANKCVPTKDFCEALPGYHVKTGQGGQPFCVPDTPPSSNCSRVIDNPFLGASGNLGCKVFPVRPTTAVDPNDKGGPFGVGDTQYILNGTPLSYAIHFENLATATGPAQVVVVTDQLDPQKVDLDTFRLGPISFGDFSLVPAPGVQTYTGGVDFRPDQNLLLTVTAGVDTITGLVTWKFVSIDPDTGQLTDDPQAGFLPPNTSPPAGEGTVVFTVMPKSGLASGTQISNQARIVFDLNAPIDTPTWLNTIDSVKPTSHVLALTATQATTTFPVQWSGSDAGSGIGGYTVFVSKDGAAFTEFVSDTSATSANFTGQLGSTYKFCSLARDLAGNVEDKACPGLAEAVTTVGDGHDLAVVKIAAPAGVLVTPGSAVTRSVGVQIQNRSKHSEVLADASVLGDGLTTGLVRLKVEMVDTAEGCQPAITSLDTAKNQALFKTGPKALKPKAKLTISYLVTYNCTNALPKNGSDPLAGDYRYTATVYHDAVDGHVDTHPEDDSCPHSALGFDPNPDGKIKDSGCGAKQPDGSFANPVTDVFRK